MENRLCLNKRPEYKLPREVILGHYMYNKDLEKRGEPKFEPDICIGLFGTPGVKEKRATCNQAWVKSDNKELIDFIREYDWLNCVDAVGSKMISMWRFKKIILEEFYGLKDIG